MLCSMSLRPTLLLAALLLQGALGAVPVAAQESAATSVAPASRPRVGLVLSGGGARGAAHVGVLKVLEEMRVPVDAIAGTSMGAVVGGLYASGLNAGAIEREIASVDWQNALSDRPPRESQNFRRKQEDREYLVRRPLGLRDGRFQLPKGLIQGQELGKMLRRLTLPVALVDDFDRLPTPFRAVATDLETGEPQVLGSGDLVTALRASMSAPGIFAPVEREGRLLVDGGLANNLPIEVARAMGVDVLIVVDVGFPLAARERLGNVTSVSNQMLAILIRRESNRQRATLGAGDVIIDPDMPSQSSCDFSRLPRNIEFGEQSARAAAAQLARYAVGEAEFAQYLAHRRSPAPEAGPVRFVRVDAASQDFALPVATLFGDLDGLPLDAREIERRVTRYYGQGTLEHLDYRVESVEPGTPAAGTGLTFSARSSSWGPNYLRFGLSLEDDFSGNSSFDASARLTMTELNRHGAEWIWDGQVGHNPHIATELFLPFSLHQRWFIAPRAVYEVRNVPQSVDLEQVAELRVRRFSYGVDVGRLVGNVAELRAGFEAEDGSSKVRLGDTSAGSVDFRAREFFLRYTLDRLDDVAFPRDGHGFMLEWRRIEEQQFDYEDSMAAQFDVRMARSWGRNTAMVWASGGTTWDGQFALPRNYYSLGGFLNLSGLPREALTGPHFGVARLVYYRKVGFGGEGILELPMYAGMSLEAGNAWSDRSDIDLGSFRTDASVFVGLDTFLGPAFLSYGYDSGGHTTIYLSLGRGF